MAAAAILDFQILEILMDGALKRAKLHHRDFLSCQLMLAFLLQELAG